MPSQETDSSKEPPDSDQDQNSSSVKGVSMEVMIELDSVYRTAERAAGRNLDPEAIGETIIETTRKAGLKALNRYVHQFCEDNKGNEEAIGEMEKALKAIRLDKFTSD